MASTFINESKPSTVKGTDRYGDTFEGEFTFKIKLSAGDQFRQDQLFREYLGGPNPEGAGEQAINLAFMLSQINARVKTAPLSWKDKRMGLDASMEYIAAVFEEALKPERAHIEALTKSAEKAQAKLRADRDEDRRKDAELEGRDQ